jgi:UDP-glucuronate decarboxylase
MRAVVTGGVGFIGSHICERLINGGAQVYCIDNLQTGRLSNVEHLLSHPKFTFVEHDVVDPLPKLPVDQVWNLACPASPPRYQMDPIHTMKTCVLGTLHALELAHRARAPMLQSSTSEVYGDPEVHPQVETYRGSVNMTGPRSCYDEGKRAAETLCFDFHRRHGVRIKVARIFNTYGPRMDAGDGRVVSNFIVRALQNKPLEIYGDGAQTRSFCYVDDLVEGLFRLMGLDEGVAGPINLGNPDEFTIAELAAIVLRLTGSRAPLQKRPLPQDDPRQRRPDIALARRLLDWAPTVSLEPGLRRTIDFLAREIGADRAARAAE